MRRPDLFIVGAPRSGTTAMRAYLGEHPEIFMASDVEPHYFGTDLESPRYIRDEERYLSLFAGATTEKHVGEKSARYLYSRRAALEIREFQPSARIIIMLRNPIEAIHSLHAINLNLGYEDITDFGRALEAEEDRRRGRRVPPSMSPAECHLLLYRETGRYTGQVQRFVDVFGWESLHVIIFDDFISDVSGAYEGVLRFLGVDPRFRTDFRKVNPTVRYRSRALLEFLNTPPPLLRSLVLALTPLAVRDRMTKGVRRLNTGCARPLDQGLRRRLQEEFLPEVEGLSALLGRDLTHWCRT